MCHLRHNCGCAESLLTRILIGRIASCASVRAERKGNNKTKDSDLRLVPSLQTPAAICFIAAQCDTQVERNNGSLASGSCVGISASSVQRNDRLWLRQSEGRRSDQYL